MSTQESDTSPGIVEMLPGVRHYQESGFATTWEAYDALTEQDGWTEKFAEHSQWKDAHVAGRWLIVHTPTFERNPPEESDAERFDRLTGQGRR